MDERLPGVFHEILRGRDTYSGFRLDDKLSGVGELGYYWASNLDKNDNGSACFLYLDGSSLVTSSYFRMGGLNIRPVVVK